MLNLLVYSTNSPTVTVRAFVTRSAFSDVSALLGRGTQRALITRRVGLGATRRNRGAGGHEVLHA
jgi:hypothetical protein